MLSGPQAWGLQRSRARLQVEEDEGLAVELFVDHASKDAHHGGTALVEFLGAEFVLFFLALVTQEANRDHGATEVTRERAFVLLPEADFQHADEANNLGDAGGGKGGDGGSSGRDIAELGSRKVNVSREADSCPGGEVCTNTRERTSDIHDATVRCLGKI